MDTNSRLKSLGINLLIAAAYWLFGCLGDLLDAPPIYASAVWPPAGIALGAVLLIGLRAMPGIWLGAVLANLRVDSFWPLPWTALPLSAGIALGACLQAAVAAYGIRRAIGQGSALNDDGSIIRFLFLAGPLGCCVSATIGGILLLGADKTTLADFPVNWGTWWIGDTIGAMIFTPLVLIAFGQPRTIWAPRWRTVALPLLISCGLVMVLFSYVRSTEQRRRLDEFNNLADTAALSLESGIHSYTDMLWSMKGFFDASEKVECGEFALFAQNLLEQKHGPQALEWAPWTLQDERKAVERELSRCGQSHAGITELSATGLRPAGQRAAYLPVTFIEPLPTNRAALGFDLLSESVRNEAVANARDGRTPAATSPITLVQDPSHPGGMLILAPVYKNVTDMASLESRRANFRGVVLGVFQIENMVDAALKSLGWQKKRLHLQIRDENALPAGQILYGKAAPNKPGQFLQTRSLLIGERTWRLSIAANERDFGQIWSTWYVLVGGLLFSGLLEGFLLLLTGRTAHMEYLIAKRTEDLADSNRRLRDEINERSKTEMALRESEGRFRTLANAAPVLMWLSGTDKLCYWFNQVWLDFTGRTEAQETGNGWTLGVHPSDLQFCLDHYSSHFDRREPFRMEYRLKRHDGEYRWLDDNGVPLFDAHGEFAGYIGSCIDITDRKHIEQSIRQINRSYQNLLAAASEVAIIATDPDGLITLFNRGAERMLGYQAVDLVGKQTPVLFHISDEITQRERQLSEELGVPVKGFQVFTAKPDIGGQESKEWTYVCKDGLCIWVSLVVTQIKSEDGKILGYLGIAQNITERKTAEHALIKAKQAADLANQAKSEFLANMSHEIRTPMNGVLGMLELLRGTPLNAEQQELTDVVGHSAQSLMAIINDILDFSKIEAGKLMLETAEFNVRELCETVCVLMAIPAQNKGLAFNCFIHPDVPPLVRGDSTRLRQVLVNLIGNAVKFTLTGEVSVEVRNISQEAASARLEFSVKDTGIGMQPEELNRLFSPFEQAEHGTTKRFGGTGLGLSISNSLVEMMGGQIAVSSEPGVGSVFNFTLNLDIADTASNGDDHFALQGRGVLVADGGSTNCEILSCFLNNWGATVTCVADGQRALDTLRTAHEQGKPFDLMIIDQSLPGLRSAEINRALLNDSALKPPPCIILSASGMLDGPISPAARALHVLAKPIRQSQLFDAVAKALHNEPSQCSANQQEIPAVKFPQFTDKQILLVEDNLINQRVAVKMLSKFGLTPELAINGTQAMQALENSRFDLVLMDCQIPDMDGYAVTRALRERELTLGLERTPVLALTANAIAGDREKSLAAGMDDHLTKPLSLNDLAVALPRWLEVAEAKTDEA